MSDPGCKFFAAGEPATIALTAICPSVPETGIGRNRNCPADKNLHRFGANLAGVRRFSEILACANHFRKDVSQLFRAVYSTTAPAALHTRPKGVCSAESKLRHCVPSKMETAHWPEYRRRAIRR